MEIKIAEKCSVCGGSGELSRMEQVYPNEPHYAPIGSEQCVDCGGSGEESDESIVMERLLENLSDEQEAKLQAHFIDLREFGGIPIVKENHEDLFEHWLELLTLVELKKLLSEDAIQKVEK